MLGSEAARQIETSTVWPVGWLILVRPFQGRRDTSTVTRGYAARPRATMSDRAAVGVRWTVFYQNDLWCTNGADHGDHRATLQPWLGRFHWSVPRMRTGQF